VWRWLILGCSGALVGCGSGASASSNGADGSTTVDAEDTADAAVEARDAAGAGISATDAGRTADAGGAADAAPDLGVSSACTSTPVWDAAAVPSCTTLPPGSPRMHVQGTLAGQSVDIQVETSGGYERSNDGGTFEAPYQGQPVTDLDVALRWKESGALLPTGSPFPASGTIRMRAGDPLGGMTMCGGSGTQGDFEWAASDAGTEDLHFHLACLTLGPDCTQPVSGEIWGCWNDGL
jgi:hypothetical protein